MFRKRQNFESAVAGRVFERRLKFDDNGNCSFVLVDGCQELPDASNFKLADLLKAGVNLQQMNTKLFDYSSPDLPDAVEDEFKDSQISNKENA